VDCQGWLGRVLPVCSAGSNFEGRHFVRHLHKMPGLPDILSVFEQVFHGAQSDESCALRCNLWDRNV
jgi:hypothetical protein